MPVRHEVCQPSLTEPDHSSLSKMPSISGEIAACRRGRPGIIFLWESFGPHHVDRCEACSTHFADSYDVYGVEIATFDANYQWRSSINSTQFVKFTLFPGLVRQKIGVIRCAFRVIAQCLQLRSRFIFMANYNEPSMFLSALVLCLLG